MKLSVGFLGLGGLTALTFALSGCFGSSSSNNNPAPNNKFVLAALVADTAAGGAAHTDPNLVNPWGLAFSPSGPFWVANNGSNTATIYDSTGTTVGPAVTVPGPVSGVPTGQVYNGTNDFKIGGLSPALFLFSSESGVITGWYTGGTAAVVANQTAASASYKGLAIGSVGSTNYIYATNFHSGGIDVFSGTFVKQPFTFTDPALPAGYAPFGIENIGGQLYVTYAVKGASGDDVAGAGNGIVDVFTTNGAFVKRLVSNGALNSPWGLAMAPNGFGDFSGALLVGNFGDGKINAYNPSTGAFVGTLMNGNSGNPVVIGGLWALKFGNGGLAGSTTNLYFTAGTGSEAHGTFGSLTLMP